jgi:hypothetical protein
MRRTSGAKALINSIPYATAEAVPFVQSIFPQLSRPTKPGPAGTFRAFRAFCALFWGAVSAWLRSRLCLGQDSNKGIKLGWVHIAHGDDLEAVRRRGINGES